MVFRRFNCGILELFRVCAIICCSGVCLFGSPSRAVVPDWLFVFDQISLAASSFSCVLGRVVTFWRPPWQLLGFPCTVRARGVLFFLLGSFFVCLQMDSCRLVLSLAQRCVAACLSIGILGGSTVRIRGWCWFCGRGVRFLFAVLRCLSSTSRGCMPFPVSCGECSDGSVRVFSPQGCGEACVFLRFFFPPAVWSSPRRQFSGVCFSSSSWKLLLDRSFSLLGLLRRFILRFVLRSVCLSLVLRVLFRSILLLVLVCLRLRTGSFAC